MEKDTDATKDNVGSMKKNLKVLDIPVEIKNHKLPLARIKRLMRIEEGIKNIAVEVPLLYSKITEVFIEDLTIKAWHFTEKSKRCIIKYEDMLKAVKSSDIYDFLLYIFSHK